MLFCFQLNIQPELRCPHCHKHDQFTLHDFIYKGVKKTEVGKRLLCSNRNGHSGCGRTIRLYISQRVPQLVYSSIELTAFLLALINGLSITQAYQDATGTFEPRNAYRWLDKLKSRLSAFRHYLTTPCSQSVERFSHRIRGLRLLLPTLERLFSSPSQHSCACFQNFHQKAFF